MRRKDREIISINEKLEIINSCKVFRLGLSQNNMPYIVPLNFGYDYSNDELVLYFHCAKDGRKVDIIKENPNVCIERHLKWVSRLDGSPFYFAPQKNLWDKMYLQDPNKLYTMK